jgi:hypothetical protein
MLIHYQMSTLFLPPKMIIYIFSLSLEGAQSREYAREGCVRGLTASDLRHRRHQREGSPAHGVDLGIQVLRAGATWPLSAPGRPGESTTPAGFGRARATARRRFGQLTDPACRVERNGVSVLLEGGKRP